MELSVRADSNSGRLDSSARGDLAAGLSTIIILIHGFNVNANDAKDNYQHMLKQLKKRVPRNFTDGICHFYWPGHESSAIASEVGYAKQIGKAENAAVMLGDALVKFFDTSPRTQFILIAHSLGCRLALEALKHIVGKNTAFSSRIRFAVLMAAAVPFSFIQNRYFQINLYTNRVSCLYSQQDTTLRYLFPLGQTLAMEGVFPKAIGLDGLPLSTWTFGHTDTGLEHRSYWKSSNVANFIASSLGIATKRLLPIRKINRRTLSNFNKL
jgi:esterase/lipase superfamily enzyme